MSRRTMALVGLGAVALGALAAWLFRPDPRGADMFHAPREPEWHER